MKNFAKIIVPGLLLLVLFSTAYAQKKHEKDDAKVTIKVNGKEEDIEVYFEEWGEEFGRKMEKMFNDPQINIDIDDGDFDMEFDHISVDIDDFAESIAEVVTKAVSNMTIELQDIDPDEMEHDEFNFHDDDDLEDLIDEIEDEYNSKVENIDNLKIKIREDYVKIDMDVTLKNGKKVRKSEIIED